MPAEEMAGDMHSVAEHRLRRIDQRYTAGRRAIIELLVTVGHPVSIEDIAERLPGVPRSSAYRHLTDLQAAGLVVLAHWQAAQRPSTSRRWLWARKPSASASLVMAPVTCCSRPAGRVTSVTLPQLMHTR